jgi:hypothetical protein
MVASELPDGRHNGHYHLDMIERQLARTGVAGPVTPCRFWDRRDHSAPGADSVGPRNTSPDDVE